MINRSETSFEKKKDSIKLQEYGSIAMHLVNCLMHVMDVSQEESLSLMMMSCIQRKMELLHEGTTRTTAALIVERKTIASPFLADVVCLGLIRGSQQVDLEDLRIAQNAAGRTTRFQVQKHQWTPQSIRDALTGDDTLGLGGNLFGQDFMAQLFAPPSIPSHDDPIPPVTPPVAVTSTSPEIGVTPFLTPPLAITPLSQRIPDTIGDLVSDQGDPMLPYPPPLPPSPRTSEDLQVKLEVFTTPQRLDTPIPDKLFQAGTAITAYKSVGSNLFSTPTQFFSPEASGSGINNTPTVVCDSPVTPVPLTTESLKRAKYSPPSPRRDDSTSPSRTPS
jgi:hypothetical protein